ncbi:class I SAM-dependent methyltransferase [Azotosporobacter soli]|uniref:class I SAM-dependent methyltransferase n=1 Tax=Azotosporobacter soli TaxID=3055040 RepID=UPI0031FE6AD0
MNEQYYEKLLNIKTAGEQKIFNDSPHYNHYEPTSYSLLEQLAAQHAFNADDHIVDFGCGKGRLNFYLHHHFSATVTGIEMDPYFYQQAIDNKKSYFKKHAQPENKIHFLHCFAEEYEVKRFDTVFYFFNPFSLQIFTKVVGNILHSIEKQERSVDIILYYPSYDYIYFLENSTPFTLSSEIKAADSPAQDPRDSFSIYRFTAETDSSAALV